MSEFGTGYAYCLGLFLAHAERAKYYKEIYAKINLSDGADMWFYTAGDHILDMQIPWFIPPMQRRKAKKFRNTVISLRLPLRSDEKATWEDVEWAIQQSKDLLRLFDATLLIKSEKGEWE